MRIIALIFGLALAAAGGTILYRALFIEPGAGIVITDTNIREVPDALRTGVGIVLLVGGACLAFLSARRK